MNESLGRYCSLGQVRVRGRRRCLDGAGDLAGFGSRRARPVLNNNNPRNTQRPSRPSRGFGNPKCRTSKRTDDRRARDHSRTGDGFSTRVDRDKRAGDQDRNEQRSREAAEKPSRQDRDRDEALRRFIHDQLTGGIGWRIVGVGFVWGAFIRFRSRPGIPSSTNSVQERLSAGPQGGMSGDRFQRFPVTFIKSCPCGRLVVKHGSNYTTGVQKEVLKPLHQGLVGSSPTPSADVMSRGIVDGCRGA
jgi:hypothetical protein